MKLPAVCRSVLLFLIALVSLAPAAPAQSQYLQNPAFANAVATSLRPRRRRRSQSRRPTPLGSSSF